MFPVSSKQQVCDQNKSKLHNGSILKTLYSLKESHMLDGIGNGIYLVHIMEVCCHLFIKRGAQLQRISNLFRMNFFKICHHSCCHCLCETTVGCAVIVIIQVSEHHLRFMLNFQVGPTRKTLFLDTLFCKTIFRLVWRALQSLLSLTIHDAPM